ncbi:MAG TPA: hypothetical protein VM940_14485 [Chthoniobacterales bacterium]|jgi:hypothetical protein|nr:hypothetical protein [Chthoniobacterales bacterium]
MSTRFLRGWLLVGTFALLTSFAAIAEPESTPRPGAIRMICLPAWDPEIVAWDRIPQAVPKALFDVSVPLAEIPLDATASEALSRGELRTGKRRSDFTRRVQFFRWTDPPGSLVRLGSSGTGSGSRQLMGGIQDGDVLIFYAVRCYFQGTPEGPPAPTSPLPLAAAD